MAWMSWPPSRRAQNGSTMKTVACKTLQIACYCLIFYGCALAIK